MTARELINYNLSASDYYVILNLEGEVLSEGKHWNLQGTNVNKDELLEEGSFLDRDIEYWFISEGQMHILVLDEEQQSKKNLRKTLLENPDIKEVDIPACERHEGIHRAKVLLNWFCPICGKPRGQIQNVRSWDGSLWMICDGWDNPCGHVDRYADVRDEAIGNGLNE